MDTVMKQRARGYGRCSSLFIINANLYKLGVVAFDGITKIHRFYNHFETGHAQKSLPELHF